MSKSYRLLPGSLVALALGATSLAPGQAAPTAPAKPAVAATEGPETVTLSEFSISTSRDLGYYSSATAGGAVLTGNPVKELALSISLLNRDLLDDLQTTDIAEARPPLPHRPLEPDVDKILQDRGQPRQPMV